MTCNTIFWSNSCFDIRSKLIYKGDSKIFGLGDFGVTGSSLDPSSRGDYDGRKVT